MQRREALLRREPRNRLDEGGAVERLDERARVRALRGHGRAARHAVGCGCGRPSLGLLRGGEGEQQLGGGRGRVVRPLQPADDGLVGAGRLREPRGEARAQVDHVEGARRRAVGHVRHLRPTRDRAQPSQRSDKCMHARMRAWGMVRRRVHAIHECMRYMSACACAAGGAMSACAAGGAMSACAAGGAHAPLEGR
eukprot:3993880-Prymnesium_polylepis.1